jgi:hypothetical protein
MGRWRELVTTSHGWFTIVVVAFVVSAVTFPIVLFWP